MVGGSVTGSVNTAHASSDNVFKIELVAGNSYRLDMSGSGSGDGTLARPHLDIHDSDGDVVSTTSTDLTQTNTVD